MKFNLKSKKVLVAIAVVSALGVGGFYLNSSKNPKVDMPEAPAVELYSISTGENVFVNGVVSPKKTKTYLQDSSLGQIEKINVNSGEMVDKGYLLYTYKNLAKEQEFQEKDALLKAKESELKILKKHPEDNKIDIQVMEKEISNLRGELSKVKSEIITKVTAPFNGVVYLEEESTNTDGPSALLTLDSRDYYIEGTVSEKDLPKLKLNMKTDVHIFSSDENRTGKISFISKRPTGGGATGEMPSSGLSQYKVRVDFDNQENLVNGFHAQAKIEITDNKIEIPVTAIFEEDGQQYVLIDDNGTARKRAIVAEIIENDTLATITSGLNINDVIVRDVEFSNLKDGDTINPDNNVEGGEIVDSVQF